VQLLRTAQPPLLGNALDRCLSGVIELTECNEAAWTYAARAGVYEAVVRTADAYPDDAAAQCAVCGGLTLLGTRPPKSRWPGHSAAGARAGAVRVAAAALRKHGTRCMLLLCNASTLLTTLVDGDAADWEAARSGHVGMSLAAGLAVALRDDEAAAAREPRAAQLACCALAALTEDKPCALEAGAGGALLSLASFLRICGDDVLGAHHACSAMMYIASHAPAAVRARAADAGVASLRFMLRMHHDPIVQHRVWHVMLALLHGNDGAQCRAVAAGLMVDIVRTLERSVEDDADEHATMAAEGACSMLDALANEMGDSHSGHREAAGDAGAVPAVLAVLRSHGCADSKTAYAACGALAGLVHRNLPNTRAALRARPFADAAAVMRAHSGSLLNALTAAMALGSLSMAHFMMHSKPKAGSTGAVDPAGAPEAFAKQLADAGVLEVVTYAIQQHTDATLDYKCLEVLWYACSGALAEGGEALQPCVAARAKQAGVEAALSTLLARTQPPPATAIRLAAALAKVPAPRRMCDGCGTADAPKLMRCSRCLAARFCGQACMRASWPAHKTVCTPAAAAASDE
jgi:hypothetical protein